MKFEVGDLIKCIDPGNNSGLTKGKTYKVMIDDRWYLHLVYIIADNGVGRTYYADRFEKVLPSFTKRKLLR